MFERTYQITDIPFNFPHLTIKQSLEYSVVTTSNSIYIWYGSDLQTVYIYDMGVIIYIIYPW